MDKLKMHSPNLVDENIEKISALFPNCITETKDENGEFKKAVDFDLLKQELSQILVEGDQERYRLDWVGKKEAILTANAPIAKTLRPCREESVNFDKTENLFIEGDNLEALKLLQENYLGKVKVIYIDPPYNTGNDFIYEDDFAENTNLYEHLTNQRDIEGNRLVANMESNGRFHSDWLSMIYSRLKLARNLLSDNGVIFISIDDNEFSNLAKICNEIFGEHNSIGPIIQDKKNSKNDTINIQKNHEYIFCYRKQAILDSKGKIESTLQNKDLITKEVLEENNQFFVLNDPITTRGDGGVLNKRKNLGYTVYYHPISKDFIGVQDYDLDLATKSNVEEDVYFDNQELINKGYIKIRPPKVRGKLGAWTWDLVNFNKNKGLIYIQETRNGYSVRKRTFVDSANVINENGKFFITYEKISNCRSIVEYSTNEGTIQLNNVFNESEIFSNPKNVNLIKHLIGLISTKDYIFLDFFAGSGSSIQALLEKNKEDNGTRKFIAIQINEDCEEDTSAFNKGFKNIADISKERIRLAGKKNLEDNANKESIENLDIGFRVLKIDSTNMKDVYYTPDALKQSDLLDLASNIKEDRTSEDLLFQVMLDWGLELSLPIERKTVASKEVFYVASNSLVACFDDLTFDVVDEIAKDRPLRFVSAEKAIHLDHDKTNIKERFKQLSPDTEVKFL